MGFVIYSDIIISKICIYLQIIYSNLGTKIVLKFIFCKLFQYITYRHVKEFNLCFSFVYKGKTISSHDNSHRH